MAIEKKKKSFDNINMRRILFVCHGNICRSQMAQSMAQYMINKAGRTDDFYIDSAATSREEIGSTMYPPAVNKLSREGIPVIRHRSRQITRDDLLNFDEIYYMDRNNRHNIERMFKGEDFSNIHPMLTRDIADPWFTDNFDATYDDILEALTIILSLD